MTKTVWAQQGQPISLPCGIQPDDSSDYALEWRKESMLIFNAFGNETGHSSAFMQGRVARFKDLALTIHSVRLEDQGSYECSRLSFGHSAKGSIQIGPKVQLIVRAPPIIHDPVNNDTQLYTYLKDLFNVSCEAHGLPTPQITWTRNNKTISQTGVLTITEVHESDQGRYECNARNDEGTSQAYIQLNLYQNPILDYALVNKTAVEGSTLFWKCSARAQPNNIIYQWSKNGRLINTLDIGLRGHIQDGEFAITNIRRSDQGWYECDASNGHLLSAKTKAYLTVQYKPKLKNAMLSRRILVFGEGTNATLDCQMDANPAPKQTFWSKNGLVILNERSTNEGDHIYILRNVTTSDAGMYACWSENVVGRSQIYEFHVIVASALRFTREPPYESTLDSGESLTVECEGFGDPMPTQYWLRGTKKISGPTLRIRNASFADHGLYQCILSNSIVSATRNFTLNVKNTRPQCIKNVQVNCWTESGFRLQFEPGYDGGHKQEFKLFYRHVPDSIESLDYNSTTWQSVAIAEKPVVELSNLKSFTKYQFFVETSNLLGSTNCTIKDQYTCSVLQIPRNLHTTIQGKLKWSPIHEASAYRVFYQVNSSKSFELYEDVRVPESHIGRLTDSNFVNFYVQAIRPPFQPSQPSEIYTFKPDLLQTPTHVYASLFITVLGLISILCYLVFGRHCKLRKTYKSTADNLRQTSNCAVAPENKDSGTPWVTRSELDGTEYDEFEDDPCGFDEYQTPHVVNEMLKHKYIYSLADDTLERIRESLHIEKLRNELKQSVL